MANTQVSCAYVVRATGQTVANMAVFLAAVPLDLALPRLWGVVPIADATTPSFPGPSEVERAIHLGFGTGGTFAGVAVLDGGEKRSPIRRCAVPGGIAGDFGAPPVLSFTDATGAGASAIVNCGLGTVFLLNGGTGYGGGTTAKPINNNPAKGGSPGTLSVTVVAGVITAVTVTGTGGNLTTFAEVEFDNTGGGSGAVAYVALKPISISMQQLGQGYTAPSLVVTPFFSDCAPDASNQAGCFANWMTQVLATGVQSVVKALAPVIT
jgi:hypothetical protein